MSRVLTSFPDFDFSHPFRDLVLAAVLDDTLTAFSYTLAPSSLAHDSVRSRSLSDSSGIAGETGLERAMVIAKVQALGRLFESGTSTLFMTHRGRVRLSELKQALRSRSEHEPFGILWDGRHATVDLEIMLLDASAQSPISIVYMDMNGLKQLNDTHGHDAGNRACGHTSRRCPRHGPMSDRRIDLAATKCWRYFRGGTGQRQAGSSRQLVVS